MEFRPASEEEVNQILEARSRNVHGKYARFYERASDGNYVYEAATPGQAQSAANALRAVALRRGHTKSKTMSHGSTVILIKDTSE